MGFSDHISGSTGGFSGHINGSAGGFSGDNNGRTRGFSGHINGRTGGFSSHFKKGWEDSGRCSKEWGDFWGTGGGFFIE